MLRISSHPREISLGDISKTRDSLFCRQVSHHQRISSLKPLRISSSEYSTSPLFLSLQRTRSSSCCRLSRPIEAPLNLDIRNRDTCHSDFEFIDYPTRPSESYFSKKAKSSQFSCPICYTECSEENVVEPLECKHRFCHYCINNYLSRQIAEFRVLKIKCAQESCSHIYSDSNIKSILDAASFGAYQQKKRAKLLNRDIHIKYCPNPGCTSPFYPDINNDSTQCACGTRICNECFNPWHEGAPCVDTSRDYELYLELNNLKKCFICKTALDKHVGCSHITCPVCDYEWCWNCGREWGPGHSSRCLNKWDPHPPRALQKEKHLNYMDEFFNGIFLLLEILVFGLIVMVGVVFIWPYVMSGKFMTCLKGRIKSLALIRLVSVLLALLTWPIAIIFYPVSAIMEEYGMCCRRKRWAKGGASKFGFHQTFCSKVSRPRLSLRGEVKVEEDNKRNAQKDENLHTGKEKVLEKELKIKRKQIEIVVR